MDAAVLDQLQQRQLGDLAADPVERREHDGLRRVVDDEVDAGQVLEGADVAALAADDAALHVVRRQLDERGRRLRGVTRRDALERVGDEVPRASLRLGLRLLLQLANAAGEVVADELLGPLEQVALRLARRHPRDPLEVLQLAPPWPPSAPAGAAGGASRGPTGPARAARARSACARPAPPPRARAPRSWPPACDARTAPARPLRGAGSTPLAPRSAPRADRLGLALGLGRAAALASAGPRRRASAPRARSATSTTQRRQEDEPYDADDFDEHARSWLDSGCPRRQPRVLTRHPARTRTSRIGPQRGSRGPGARLHAVCRDLLPCVSPLLVWCRHGVVVSEPIQKTLGMQAKCRVKQTDILAPIRPRLQRASAAPPRSHPRRTLGARANAPSRASARGPRPARSRAPAPARAPRSPPSPPRRETPASLEVGADQRVARAALRERSRARRRAKRRVVDDARHASARRAPPRRPWRECRRRRAARAASRTDRSRWRSARAAPPAPRRDAARGAADAARRAPARLRCEPGAHCNLERDPTPGCAVELDENAPPGGPASAR